MSRARRFPKLIIGEQQIICEFVNDIMRESVKSALRSSEARRAV